MSVHINDLPLKKIISFLPEKQQFVIERVCKEWQKCTMELLEEKETLHQLNYYSKKFQNPKNELVISRNNIDILKKILSRCHNIKRFSLVNTQVTSQNLLSIANLCPKLERIDFTNSKISFVSEEINEFAKTIGPQLKECRINKYDEFMKIIFHQLKNIEIIYFNSKEKIDDSNFREVFNHLNTNCKSLKVLYWKFTKYHNFRNRDFINVLERIQNLAISFSIFLRLEFKVDNLTELTLYRYNLVDDQNLMLRKTFPNLKKLNLYYFKQMDFALISKSNFPKLDSVSLYPGNSNEIRYKKHRYSSIPSSFIEQIKHIKTLQCSSVELVSPIFGNLNQLDNLIWNKITLNNDTLHSQFIGCLDAMSKHETLRNIKLEIEDKDMKFKINFFNKLNSFCHSKPNTKIIIKITKYGNKYNDYKKMLEEATNSGKVNIKLLRQVM